MVIFAFVLFSFSFGAAATTCAGGDDQVIMRLYSPSNSHISAWDQNAAVYDDAVCHDSIFGFEYGGANPHDDNGDNRVLSLSALTNAHASQTTDAVYATEVYYGNLECVYDSSAGSACSNGGEIVARMSASSNAHVSFASDTNYATKICCESLGVYWADMGGNIITTADYGDMIQLVSKGTSSGTFDIKEHDSIFGVDTSDDIRSIVGADVDGDLIGIWTIEDSDLAATSGDYDEFYFEIDGQESDYLVIDENGNDTPMEITIVSPACGNHYDEGISLNVVVSAEDDDDIITGVLKINGAEYDFTNGGRIVSVTLDTPGNMQIIAEASNTRGERSRSISNIMVLDMTGATYVDGDYVAACIDKPIDFTNIPGSVVEFDASSTRGINVTGGFVTELIPGPGVYFSWYWMFYPQNIARNLENTDDELAYKFTAEFPVAGDNSASLRVEI